MATSRVAAIIKEGKLAALPSGDGLIDAGGNSLIGVGDMTKAIYDPTTVNGDAFSQDNMNDGTINKNYSATDKSKLAGIEALADVTDAINVNDAGATMNTDTDVSANSWVIDEDNMASNLDTKVPTQQSVKAYCDALIGANDAMLYKGLFNCSANPDYPAGNAGDTYKVSAAGRIGGVSGKIVEVGDMAICLVDSSPSGDEAAIGANWDVLQVNIDGAVTTGDSSSTDLNIVVEDGTSGTIHKDGGKTIAEVERKRMVINETVYFDGQNELSSNLGMDVAMPYAGYIVGVSIKMRNARTAGDIAIEPHVNGIGITPTPLDLTIDAVNTIKDTKVIAYGTSGYEFMAGDTIGFLLTSTSFTPLDNKAELMLIVEVEA